MVTHSPPNVRYGPLDIAARLDRLPISRWHWRLVLLIGLATFFDIYEIFMSGVLGGVLGAEWDLSRNAKAALIAAPFVGMIFGAIFLGMTADRWGRRKLFMFTLAAYSILSIAGAFSPDIETLIILRMISGVFLGAEPLLVDTYLSEMLPKRRRGRLIAIAYAIGFIATPVVALLGAQFVAKTHFLVDGWRWLLVIGGLGALAVFLLRRGLPESPRWLAAKNRGLEADAITTDIERAVERSTGTLPAVAPIAETVVRNVTLRDMFRPPYRRRTTMLWIFQAFQTVGQYGFSSLVPLILVAKGYDIVQSLGYTALTFIGAPIGAALAIPLIERFERKHLIIASALISAGCGVVFGNAGTPALIVAMGLVITISNNVMSSSYHIYQGELFPTKIRSSAIGIAYALSRFSAALLPFVGLLILQTLGVGWVFGGAAALLVVVALTVGILGPRTNGRSLESIALLDRTGPATVSEPTESRIAAPVPAASDR